MTRTFGFSRERLLHEAGFAIIAVTIEGREIARASAGMSPADFEEISTDWLAKARHPRGKRRYTELAYQSIFELYASLRASGFKRYIVSGGGVEFMQPVRRSL